MAGGTIPAVDPETTNEDDVGAEHLDENRGEQTTPWNYMFQTRRPVVVHPNVVEVKTVASVDENGHRADHDPAGDGTSAA